ncbi:unnamed protein product [Porites evermanni]|uniref:DDE Tnp4 domain-containing protein n=1 Tax=Porites evermanni TaxID=104178 RepID=A0ABN8MMA4_9CNID|nr:unnamed protein product [Porites evermanni]
MRRIDVGAKKLMDFGDYKGNERKEQNQKAAEERAERARERRKRSIERQEVEVAEKRKHLNVSGDRVVDIHFTETSTSTSTEEVEEDPGIGIHWHSSDKFLTENCGFLDKLLPGDMVMEDRGFTVSESVGLKQAKLVIPAFTKGMSQLDPVDVEKT